jgi:signal transduction histidine kinase
MNIPVNRKVLVNPARDQIAFVEDQFIDLFLKQNKRAQTGLLLSSVLIFLLLLFKIHNGWPYAWMVCIALLSGFRFVLTDSWVRSAIQPRSAIAALLLLNGCALMSAVFFFGQLSDIDHAFITIVLTAVATASVVTTSGYKRIFLWFAAPLFISLSVAWGINTKPVDGSQWVGWGIGGLLIAYLLFLIKLGEDVSRIFHESCLIRFLEHDANSRLTSALEEAKQATLAKSRFLASASHDLRQPLHTTGVLLAALGLRNLDDRSREIVKLLDTVSKSLSGQLDGLLDISKLDAGVMPVDLRSHRLDQIVKAHVAQLEPLAQEKNLHMRVQHTQPLEVQTDIHLIQRLLGNLTSNALKFTHQGGIDISLQHVNGQAVLEVIDSGIGIAHEHQELIFQEFYQIGNPERDRSVGLGLGLAIVSRIGMLLGIGIQVVSSPGQGSRFILTMPCTQNETIHSAPALLQEPLNLHQLSVLVVDDEKDVRQGMRLLLEELGCAVMLADSVGQAVACAEQQKFQIIISDFRLRNQETGLDVIRKVRAIQPSIYPLLISGDTAQDRLQQVQATGIAFLHKPVAVEALIKHLQNVEILT